MLDPLEIAVRSPIPLIQLLLPEKAIVFHLVEFHANSLLWYHSSYVALSFRNQLRDFYALHHGSIEHDATDIQWVALLFSIMTGALACAPMHQTESWGFHTEEQHILCKRWYKAVTTCLNLADYTSCHSIFSVQAIATLTASAPLLGFSKPQCVLLASAVRISQSLGLHRVDRGADVDVVDSETGIRAWLQVCTQDWFSIPFTDTCLINPLHSQVKMPRNCHDHNMVPLPETQPTITSYSRVINSFAALIPRHHDSMAMSATPYTKYEQVLRYDKQLRVLFSASPPFLKADVPLDASWPAFIPWARRALILSFNHKLIMIHRKFLGNSFTNPAFSYTRRACLAAAKTIIAEFKLIAEEDVPLMWFYQAFAIAACVVLCLELLQGERSSHAYAEYRRLVLEATSILSRSSNSVIASRGVKVVSALLAETVNIRPDEHLHPSPSPYEEDQGRPGHRLVPRKRRAGESDAPTSVSTETPLSTTVRRQFDVLKFVGTYHDRLGTNVAVVGGQAARHPRGGTWVQRPTPQSSSIQATPLPYTSAFHSDIGRFHAISGGGELSSLRTFTHDPTYSPAMSSVEDASGQRLRANIEPVAARIPESDTVVGSDPQSLSAWDPAIHVEDAVDSSGAGFESIGIDWYSQMTGLDESDSFETLLLLANSES